MASYARLLLSAGGGIISALQQAEQARNTASVLIGLGGTGVHCIRTIKTQVYDRLKPDIPGAPIPTYAHIRFLGVDSAEASKRGALRQDPKTRLGNGGSADQIMPLSDNEFFSIANNQLQRAFQHRQALKHRKELSWLEYETIRLPDLTDAGAGGIRQVGRFMLIDRYANFTAKLEQEIEKAKIGLDNPRVNIHVFSGLSGGTGSGCFLDVCYLIRSIADKFGAVTIFGYFFLPDVNLAPVPRANPAVRDYICKNGYASMQELDYCMNLQFNGGGFSQIYQANRPPIPWTAAPVDMCHLICATDQDNNAIDKAYDYAMNVTAEYLMDFLTDSNAAFDLQQHLSNFQSMIGEANQKKLTGACMDYCIIGAACATVPLREINTDLAAELFHRFAEIRRNRPERTDAERFAFDALAPGAETLDEVYDALSREVQKDAAPEEYDAYPEGWPFVRDYGNKDLLDHYGKQTAAKKARMTANAKIMMDENNEQSLIRRVRNALETVIRDLNRGPIYAYAMMSAAEPHNIINLIDGWIRRNEELYQQASQFSSRCQKDYENARGDFDDHAHSIFSRVTNGRRFAAYEFYLCAAEQHELELETRRHMGRILKAFREQVMDAAANYYVRLSRVTNNLIDTFEDNREALKSNSIRQNLDGFATPMMTVAELKPALDKEIGRLNVPNMLNAFMSTMLRHGEEWLSEDEGKISRLVTEFFLDAAFQKFSRRNITNFLRDKYEIQTGDRIDDDRLTEYVYNDWVRPLTKKARPLFYFNNSIWQESQTSKLAFLSYPSESSPISAAARRRNAEDALWGLKTSALTDRIFVMSSACGLPLSAYNNCQAYEQMLYSSKSVGRRYYEGKPVPGMAFYDWRKLPSVMPQSVLSATCDEAPPDLQKSILSGRDLWERARKRGVLDDESAFYAIADVERLQKACDDCREAIERAAGPDDLPPLEAAADAVRERLHAPLSPTGARLPQDGDRNEDETIFRIQEDHFVSSPAFHASVRETVAALEAVEALLSAVERKKEELRRAQAERERAQEAEAAARRAEQERIRQAEAARKRVMNDFCEALFTGVITLKGRTVSVQSDAFHKPVTLSEFSEEFPYAKIPPYQAYLNYQKLDEEETALIRKEYQRRYNEDAPELKRSGEALRSVFTDERIAAFVQMSDAYDNADEIGRFLRDFRQRFKAFCLDNQL